MSFLKKIGEVLIITVVSLGATVLFLLCYLLFCFVVTCILLAVVPLIIFVAPVAVFCDIYQKQMESKIRTKPRNVVIYQGGDDDC